MQTLEDQKIEQLEAEFPPFQVWVDLRPRDDGREHWHARLPGWNGGRAISAMDDRDMRDKLIIWCRQNEG